jgi:hypothetical protein
MRSFILGRLTAYLHILPPKPIQVCIQLVKETWARMDRGEGGYILGGRYDPEWMGDNNGVGRSRLCIMLDLCSLVHITGQVHVRG